MEQTLSVFNFLLKIVSFTTLLRENNETGIKPKTDKITIKTCLFIDINFNLHKNTSHIEKLQDFTLLVFLFMLHTAPIPFTKRTFYLFSDYIFLYNILFYRYLQKSQPYPAIPATS